ncbi:MAG: plasma-membrane proton-efflux P-type ATPase [Microbacter sp.]
MNGSSTFYESGSIDEVLKNLQVEKDRGLSDAEVKDRQAQYGLNEVKEKKPSILLLIAKKFWGLTAFMLEITILVSLLLGRYIDVYLIGGLMIFNAAISLFQDLQSAKTVETLKKKLQVIVRVLRNKQWVNIMANELVPGDILRIRTGDFITADAKIIQGNLSADQSALTGESLFVDKKEGDMLYSGSIVRNGECNAVVTSTGIHTFFGKTTALIQTAKPRLHMEEVVSKVVQILFLIVIVFVGISFGVSLIRGVAFLSILPLLLILLVSAVPIALPAMFTVSMAKGAKELADKGVLVTRLSATEDAATLTTLCLDKTGTLTQNKLTVERLAAASPYSETDVLRFGILASVEANNDPIDMAFINKARANNVDNDGYRQVSFTPFNAEIKRTEAIVEKEGVSFKIMKGAYETLKALSNHSSFAFDDTVKEWAEKGFRTLAVAIEKGEEVSLVGIAALIDPPMPDSAQLIQEIKALGVKVKMLTGDALPIAQEIAREVGIGNNIVSASLLRNDDSAFDAHDLIIQNDGFAGVVPEDKFNIVKNLQKHHEITGMTGDGVNDAPALKQAEVGIAVMSATDVAKQAASVILLKSGLESITNLITIGRMTHHRITNWVMNKISKTFSLIIFVCLTYLLSGYFVVNAFDMVMLLLLIDFVTLSLSTDIVEWSKSPNSWNIQPIIKKGFIIGIFMLSESLLWFWVAKNHFHLIDVNQIHSLGFAILFFSSIFNIIIVRTDKRFYKQPIGKLLLLALTADSLLVSWLLMMGLAGFTSVSWAVVVSSIFYFAFVTLIINDWIKLKI